MKLTPEEVGDLGNEIMKVLEEVAEKRGLVLHLLSNCHASGAGVSIEFMMVTKEASDKATAAAEELAKKVKIVVEQAIGEFNAEHGEEEKDTAKKEMSASLQKMCDDLSPNKVVN